MRVRIIGTPTGEVDGIPLDRMLKGGIYHVGTSLGCYLLACGLAEPVTEQSAEIPAVTIQVDDLAESSIVPVRDTASEVPSSRPSQNSKRKPRL